MGECCYLLLGGSSATRQRCWCHSQDGERAMHVRLKSRAAAGRGFELAAALYWKPANGVE
jgi:hypothetical protein